MRILIRTDIGSQHGLGHGVRMRALARALTAQRVRVTFTSSTHDLRAFIAPFAVQEPWFPNMPYRPCDVYVIDTKAEDLGTHPDNRWQTRGIKIVRIDDPHAISDTCDLLIGPCAHWDTPTVERLRHDFGERFLYGWDYVMLDEDVTQHAPIPYTERVDGPIVFCAGGSDPDDVLAQMYDWCAPLMPDHEKCFLLGSHYTGRLRGKLEGGLWAEDVTTRRILQPYARETLRHAGLVVALFGVTVYECLFWQVPCLVFARTEEDEAFLSKWELACIRENLMDVPPFTTRRQWKRCSPEFFRDMITRHFHRIRCHSNMPANSCGRIDGQGIARVADAILHV